MFSRQPIMGKSAVPVLSGLEHTLWSDDLIEYAEFRNGTNNADTSPEKRHWLEAVDTNTQVKTEIDRQLEQLSVYHGHTGDVSKDSTDALWLQALPLGHEPWMALYE